MRKLSLEREAWIRRRLFSCPLTLEMVDPSSSCESNHILMEGILTKSPPNQDNPSETGNFLRDLHCLGSKSPFLRKRWRRRYCVLYKVRGLKKTEVFFDYYKDAKRTKLKGRVDLHNCECIVDNVEIGKWSNVFSIQTLHKDRGRIYYFAADTHELMSKWVRSLVDVTQFHRDLFADLGYNTITSAHSTTQRSYPFARNTRGVSSSLATLTSPFGTVNPTWLRQVCELMPTDNYPIQGDDSYNDPGAPETYYSPSVVGDELDEYNPLPDLSHVYVNLETTGVGTLNTGEESTDIRVSCPNLAQEAPALPPRPPPIAKTQTLTAPPRPARERGPVSTKSNAAINEDPRKTLRADIRRASSNSVYLNMWETGDADDSLTTPPALAPKPNSVQSAAPPVIPRTKGTTCNSRVYRRSQIADSDYQPIASASQSSLSLSVATTDNANHNKLPSPTGALSSAISSLPVAVKPAYQSGPNAIARLPSIEACNDLELPKRAPGLGDIGDSSIDSDSDSSLLPATDDTKADANPMATLTAADPSVTHSELSTSNGTEAGTKVPTETSPKIETRPNADSSLKDPVKQVQQHLQQLNYIEPCNLELGSNSTTNATTRPLTNLGGPNASTMSNPGLIADKGPIGKPRVGPIVPSRPDDDCIEYKEIDPISTNALAIVTKHYLDDDTCPR